MLKVQGLQKKYPGFSFDCSLQVKKGQITGLIGQNGAGKSTAFKGILGLTPFDKGEVWIDGVSIRNLSSRDREKIGVVLCDSGFSGYLKIRELIPILKALYQKFDQDFFCRQLTRFALPLHKQIKTLSTGMKMKLKLLVALSHDARLLILDEPTAGLDVTARDDLLLLLREYMEQHENCAVLISSHISSDLEGLCDDCYLIHQGKILLHQDTDVLLDRYALLKMTREQFKAIDKHYLLASQKEAFGYAALTDQRSFYEENAPQITVEKASLDCILTMMIRGDRH